MSFETAFWDRQTSQSSTKENSDPNPVFQHFLHPLYSSSNPHSHDLGMMSLYSLPGGIIHPTLLFYIHGEFAKEMTDRLEHHVPGSESYNSSLEQFLYPYYSRLANFDHNTPECQPRAFYATSWQKDAFAGFGSYTNFQIPQPPVEEGSGDYPYLDEDIKALRHGLPERGLWLAGEHTAPFVALGTVTGAYWSGDAVGKRIVAWLEGKVEDAAPTEDDCLKGNETVDDGLTVQVGKGGKESITGVKL